MALSTKATLAAVGGALAIGALGVTGVAYASEGTGTPSYVTTVQEDGTAASTAPGTAADRDCPEKDGTGGSGSGGSGSGSPESVAPGSSTADDA